jgi:hypothetical protein
MYYILLANVHLSRCWILLSDSLPVNVCLLWVNNRELVCLKSEKRTTSLKIGTGLSQKWEITPFWPNSNIFLQVISVVVTFIIYLLNILYFIMKYIKNTAKTRMHMDKSNIYFSNGNVRFTGKCMLYSLCQLPPYSPCFSFLK